MPNHCLGPMFTLALTGAWLQVVAVPVAQAEVPPPPDVIVVYPAAPGTDGPTRSSTICAVVPQPAVDWAMNTTDLSVGFTAKWLPVVLQDRTIRSIEVGAAPVPVGTAHRREAWHLARIGMPEGKVTEPVVIALLDGGLTAGTIGAENTWTGPDGKTHGANCAWPGECSALGPIATDTHGDSMAAIIAGPEKGGVRGLAMNAKIMAINVFRPDGWRLSGVIHGLQWAKGRGARLANLSLDGIFETRRPNGTYGVTPEERAALLSCAAEFAGSDGLAVVAAGNFGTRITPETAVIPDGVVVVAGHDVNGSLSMGSGWGPSVAIAAPGTDILYWDAHAKSVVQVGASGSSPAAALVSAAIALHLGLQPTSAPGSGTSTPRAAWTKLAEFARGQPLLDIRVQDGRTLAFPSATTASPVTWAPCPSPSVPPQACPPNAFLSVTGLWSGISIDKIELPAEASAVRLRSQLSGGPGAHTHATAHIVTIADPHGMIKAWSMGYAREQGDFDPEMLFDPGNHALQIDSASMAVGTRECVLDCQMLVPLH